MDEYTTTEAPKKDNRTMIIIVVVVVVLLCCCCCGSIGAYYLYQNGDEIFNLSSRIFPLLL